MHTPYILHIDTATEVCSVSLSKGDLLLHTIETQEPNQHAARLTLFIEEILERQGLSSAQLDAIAVSKGPGSYTGLRIGVSTAKGLCYGADLPLIGINTLESMLEGYKTITNGTPNTLYCPMLDARRMEVYMSTWNSRYEPVTPTDARIIGEDSFADDSMHDIRLFGSGARKFEELFADRANITIDKQYKHSSKHMHKLALQRYIDKEFEDIIYFEPFYLKEFVATTPKKNKL
jgi:tRNA threonylcarbamoyladenosine biosynthesis protein TsaB